MNISKLKRLICLSILMVCPQVHAQWNEIESNEGIYQNQTSAFKQLTFDITIDAQKAIEFKLTMKKNDSVVYNWITESDANSLGQIVVEFHGHTEKVEGELGTLIFYKKHTQGHEQGSLTAPFDGIHGWYVENNSDEPLTIHLDVAGWFDGTSRVEVPR